MISVAIATFDAMPYPSHSTSIGARAKTGMAWLTTSTGSSHRRAGLK